MSWTNETKPAMNVEYIATEALDYLLTESGEFLVTNQSNTWSKIVKAITNWTNTSK